MKTSLEPANNYDVLAKFYDKIIGDRTNVFRLIEGFIKEHSDNAKSLLELACGTGDILNYFKDKFEVVGLDKSERMLDIARTKLPNARLEWSDMVSFRFGRTFDVILCVTDSINHVMKTTDLERMFENVRNHLNDGGLFIFDLNTMKRLNDVIENSPHISQMDEDYYVLNLSKAGNKITNWEIKIFEHISGNLFELHEEMIQYSAHDLITIKQIVENNFKGYEVLKSGDNYLMYGSERIYFICRK